MKKKLLLVFLFSLLSTNFAHAMAAKKFVCEGYKTCDVTKPCEAQLQCMTTETCAKPICINPKVACEQVCGKSECIIQESHPARIVCKK